MIRTATLSLLLLSSLSLFAAADREASRPAVMIPISGTVPGANGTRFQTDLTITNQSSERAPALIDVYWLPRDVAGTGVPLKRLMIEPHAVELYEDFVTQTLNVSGLGTIILRAVHEDGSANLAGRIDAFARIWTPVPGTNGTTSQAVHASTLYSPLIDDLQPIAGMIYGLRQDASFRSNYGLVNMGTKPLTFTVRFRTGGETISEQVTVEAQSMTHRPVPATVAGRALTIVITPHQRVQPVYDPQPWTAYGSSVDNTSGDAWYSKAQASYPYNERS